MVFEMPERTAMDGRVGVGRENENIVIEATHGGQARALVVTPYNAARILAMLCIMLEVPIPRALRNLPMGSEDPRGATTPEDPF